MSVSATTVHTDAPNDFSVPGSVQDYGELPDAMAPMVRNAWYVVAESKKVGRELRGIRVLGEPLVLYRTQSGEPIVLDDRCAHRRFPLSRSKLVGDSIQCGYHGFTYDHTGRCIWAANVKPQFGVRRYPCAEVGPWLWAWMGDPQKADRAAVPYPKLDPKEPWRAIEGYKLNPGNYMLLIENLFDVSHLHFLHGGEVSDLAQATTPSKKLADITNGVGYIKETTLAQANLFASLTGGDPKKRSASWAPACSLVPRSTMPTRIGTPWRAMRILFTHCGFTSSTRLRLRVSAVPTSSSKSFSIAN
jgi:phenylpropionate dioxygenase-like ring-hydroxylating dioxygenase large terminal subunit